MVAAGDDVHAGGEDFLGGLGRDARAAGGVLAVGDDEVKPVLLRASWGTSSLTARRPGSPTMSPMKSSFTPPQ